MFDVKIGEIQQQVNRIESKIDALTASVGYILDNVHFIEKKAQADAQQDFLARLRR